MMMGRSYGFGPFGCGPLLMFLIFLFVGSAIFLMIRHQRRRTTSNNQGPQAQEILNERLAKGEITLEEYEKIKKVIQ